jgi:hypothetical protein
VNRKCASPPPESCVEAFVLFGIDYSDETFNILYTPRKIHFDRKICFDMLLIPIEYIAAASKREQYSLQKA